MSEGIIIALITGGLSFAGVIITSLAGNKKLINNIKLELATYKASTDEKITELTREVRRHNGFAERLPIVENEMQHIQADIKRYHKQ